MAGRHMTASVAVVDADREQILLVWHQATARWMIPGGHVEAGEAPHETALRECSEETGLVPCLWPGWPVWPLPGMAQLPTPWRVYEIPAPAKGVEAAHSHVDFLYVATGDAAVLLRDENAGSCRPTWVRVAEIDRWGVRAEVPAVAREALRMVRGQAED